MGTPAELLKNLQYDRIAMDNYEAANKYIKSNDYKFNSIVGGQERMTSNDFVKEIKIVSQACKLYTADFNSLDKAQWFDFSKEWSYPEDVSVRTGIMNKISQELTKNAQVFAQIEFVMRNIPPEDVLKHDIQLMVQYFNFYASASHELTPGKQLFILTKATPLGCFGMAVSSALASGAAVYVLATEPVAIVAHLFGKICLQAGVPPDAIGVYLIPEDHQQECVAKAVATLKPDLKDVFAMTEASLYYPPNTNYMFGGNTGCTVVVTESADIDSAIDMVISESTWNYVYPWRTNRLVVQESIYEEFKDRFKARICTPERTERSVDVALPRGAVVWHCPTKSNAHPARVVISENINLNTEIMNDRMEVMTMQAYRTTKELLALINNEAPFALSVWCDGVSVSNEISLGAKVPVVWVNLFGAFDATVPLRVRDWRLNTFGGDLGIAKHKLFKDGVETFGSYETNDKTKEILKSILQNLNKLLASWKTLTVEKRMSICMDAIVNWQAQIVGDREAGQEVLTALTSRGPESSVAVLGSRMRIHLSEAVGITLVQSSAKWGTKAIAETIASTIHGNGLIYNFYPGGSFRNHLIEHLSHFGVPVVVLKTEDPCYQALRSPEIRSFFIIGDHYSEGMGKLSVYYTKQIWTPVGETFAN